MLEQPKLNAIDVHVGSRIRMQRVFKGMSQSMLADGLALKIVDSGRSNHEKGASLRILEPERDGIQLRYS